jgi:hypothetical protein
VGSSRKSNLKSSPKYGDAIIILNNKEGDRIVVIKRILKRMNMQWIKNDNAWFLTNARCVKLCKYVLHIFHEDT